MLLSSLLLTITVLCSIATANDLKIEIKQGVLKGRYDTTIKGKRFRSFTGIPYAEPPVGTLRFKPPEPAKQWQGVLDATKPHSVCPQINVYSGDYEIKGDEDCLYLNVYAPMNSAHNKFAVMFYVHGGGWMCGNANAEIYGPHILLDRDVVLVTTNYRLGALGFMSTGDSVLPGNNGMKDQNLALKWVKANIEKFGGDPERITVFGQSAGGASSHLHALSPLSKDLISGAIIQSGSALAPWAVTLNPLQQAKKLASYLDCPTESSEAIVKCISTKDSYEIVAKEMDFLEYSYHPMIPFKVVVEPNIDGAFLTEDPAVVVKSKRNAKVPIMVGLTTEDGAVASAQLYKDPKLVKELNDDFERVAPLVFLYDQATYNTTQVSKKIRKFYFGDRPIDESTKSELTNAITDTWFYVPTDRVIRMHTANDNNPVYYYLFEYLGFGTYTTIYKSPEDNYNYGSCHSDELLYLFTQTIFPTDQPSKADNHMMDVMTALWTNFAKTGNPTPEDDKLLAVKWKPVSSKKQEHYFIGRKGEIRMGENWEIERLRFSRKIKFNSRWNEVKDEL